jgi:tRNA pseudouridine55 synthase
MHEPTVNVYKPLGLTPFQIVGQYRKKYPKHKNKKVAYAGRLDPLAHGVLLLLVEPETKNAKKYQGLDKEYEFEVLFGVRTDTYDVLGRLDKKILRQAQDDKADIGSLSTLSNTQILEMSKTYEGKYKQPYPPYSSKTVKGKPLFWWAREGKLGEIKIPSKEIEIYSLSLIKTRFIDTKILSYQVTRKVNAVKGNFRQKEILRDWKDFFENSKQKKFQIAKFIIHCSSGTYIRQIAHEMGQKLGCVAIAFDILRTKVGKFKLNDSINLK